MQEQKPTKTPEQIKKEGKANGLYLWKLIQKETK